MKVSILVPVYSVAQFIEECAVSVFEQTYKDLEFIFVDDCSPDDSIIRLESVIERYPERKAQTYILHHDHNRGSGATRSTALAAATGDFVCYVDSDDILLADAITQLVQRQTETGADIIDGAYCRLSSSGLYSAVPPYPGDSDHLLRLMIVKNTVGHQLWGRLIRRSLHTDYQIDFTEGVNMGEDYGIMPRLLFYGRHACIDDIIYYYRINDSGTFASGLNDRNICSFLAANRIVGQFLATNDTNNSYQRPYAIGMLQTYASALATGMSPKTIDGCVVVPRGRLFACCRTLLCHWPTLPLLRWTYRVLKNFYVRRTINR